MRYEKDENTYILGNFNNGDTVTIDVYKLSDNSQIVSGASCTEIGTVGVFKYQFSQTVTAKTEYLWIMSNGTADQRGKIVLGGWMDDLKDSIADQVWDETLSSHLTTGSTGEKLNLGSGGGGLGGVVIKGHWTKKEKEKLFDRLDSMQEDITERIKRELLLLRNLLSRKTLKKEDLREIIRFKHKDSAMYQELLKLLDLSNNATSKEVFEKLGSYIQKEEKAKRELIEKLNTILESKAGIPQKEDKEEDEEDEE